MELNKIYHGDFTTNTLPDKCANLIIADPPYFEVKSAFDFVWEDMKAYLQDVEKWAKECKRLLADNGTLFWYGMDRKIAYSQVILDQYFELIGTLVWEKPSIANEWDTRRTFPERGQERILMYCATAEDETGWEIIKENIIKPIQPFANYFRQEFERAKVTNKEIAKLFPSRTGGLTGCVSNWLNGDNTPTEHQYNTIRNYLGAGFLEKNYADLMNDYNELKKQYEALRLEYEKERRHFDNYLGLTDVLRFSREHDASHPTQKPEELTRALVLTCSRPNDLVLVPFAGSGTECAMAAKEGRRFIGWDVEQKYVEMSNNRVTAILRQPTLFQEAWVANTNTRGAA